MSESSSPLPPQPAPGRSALRCPNCGATASGKFCSECGAALEGAQCAACKGPLVPGARFCHHCGTAVGGAAPVAAVAGARDTSLLPWGVAGVAALALIALVAVQRTSSPDTSIAPAAAEAPTPAPAPDISRMTPRERADRLFERIMLLSSRGKADSAAFFASMALAVYPSLSPLDTDLRYDYGRVAEVAGVSEIARAQADTILNERPTHLLGLVLAARAARLRGDAAAARVFDRRLLTAEGSELGRNVDEYKRHRPDIDQAIAEARKGS